MQIFKILLQGNAFKIKCFVDIKSMNLHGI